MPNHTAFNLLFPKFNKTDIQTIVTHPTRQGRLKLTSK